MGFFRNFMLAKAARRRAGRNPLDELEQQAIDLLEEVFQKFVKDLQDACEDELMGAIRNMTIAAVRDEIDFAVDKMRAALMTAAVKDFQDEWGRSMAAVLEQAADAETQALSMPYSFTLNNPFAISWLQNNGSDLVAHVTDSTIETIRQTIQQGVEQQRTVRDTARVLRDVVGLLPRDAETVLNMRASGVSEGDIERFSDQKVRERSLAIARTETIRGLNAGKAASWDEAAQNGYLTSLTKKKWNSGKTERTCDICGGLGVLDPVPIDKPFVFKGVEYMLPPAHPLCRCNVTLVTRVETSAGMTKSLSLKLSGKSGSILSLLQRRHLARPRGRMVA